MFVRFVSGLHAGLGRIRDCFLRLAQRGRGRVRGRERERETECE